VSDPDKGSIALAPYSRVMRDARGSVGRYVPLVLAAVVVVATGVVGASLFGAAGEQPSGEDILENVEQRYDDAETVVGTAEVLATNGTERYAATVEYAVAEGNNSRVTVHANGSTVVAGTNGSHAWVYDPATGLARVYDEATLEQRHAEYEAEFEAEYGSYEQFRERYGDNVTATLVGTETVGSEAAYVLRVVSTNESIDTEGRLWVDREEDTVLKAQATGENGTVTVRFSDTRFDVSVHASTYRPPTDGGRAVPDADRETYDSFGAAQSATALDLPDLRSSYDFEETVVASYQGETTATAAYETGYGTAYIAVTTADRIPDEGETRQVAGRPVTVASAQGGAAAYWTDGDVTTAVVVRGPESSALAVAETLLG
jgi:outer membrane lipoprotein-sorting protein